MAHAWSRRARIESLISAAVNWACSGEPSDIGALGFCAAKRMLFARLAGREWSVMRCDRTMDQVKKPTVIRVRQPRALLVLWRCICAVAHYHSRRADVSTSL